MKKTNRKLLQRQISFSLFKYDYHHGRYFITKHCAMRPTLSSGKQPQVVSGANFFYFHV